MKHLLYLLFIFTGLCARAQETYSISGTVTDKNGEAVPGATVFLANTKNIIATSNDGKFQFEQLQPGNYEVVVKMLGFNVYHRVIIIQKNSINLPVKLEESTTELKTVTINGMTDEERKMLLQLFIKSFIGESDYAAECKLLNPKVLNFTRSNFIFEATSDDFLIIENKALGYKIHYLLLQFKVDYYNHLTYYDGTYYFEELKGSKSKQKTWEKNRAAIYEGSQKHFFKAAFNNTLKQEGFWVYQFPNQEAIKVRSKKQEKINEKYFSPISDFGTLSAGVNEHIKMLDFKPLKKDSTELYIFYVKKGEPESFVKAGRKLHTLIHAPFPTSQLSIISPLADSVLIDKNGTINPFNGLVRSGYWTWNKAAGFLPDDYTPAKSNETH